MSIIILFSVGSIVILLTRIISFVSQDDVKILSHETKYPLHKLTTFGSRFVAAEYLLSQKSTNICLKVTRTSEVKLEITAKDVNLEPGDYVIDIDLHAVNHLLGCSSCSLNGNFRINIGDQVTQPDETILTIIDGDIKESSQEEISNELARAIKAKGFDPFFNQNNFSNEYEILYDYVDMIRKRAKNSVKSGNIEMFKKSVYEYQTLFYRMNLSSNISSDDLRHLRSASLNNLLEIFEYLLKMGACRPPASESFGENINTIQAYNLVDQTYFMAQELAAGNFNKMKWMDGDNKTKEELFFQDLLRRYEKMVRPEDRELAKYIHSQRMDVAEYT